MLSGLWEKSLLHTIDESVLGRISYQHLTWERFQDNERYFDQLWLASWFLKQPRPGWHGSMQKAMMARNNSGKAEIVFLPIIDNGKQ